MFFAVALPLTVRITAVVVGLRRSMMSFRLGVSEYFFVHLRVHGASTLNRFIELPLVARAKSFRE